MYELILVISFLVPVLAFRVQVRALRTSSTLSATSPSKRSIFRRIIENKQNHKSKIEEEARIEWESLERAAAEAGDAFRRRSRPSWKVGSG